MNLLRLSSDVIPQAERPEFVLRVLAFIEKEGRRPTPVEVGLDYTERYVDYCCHAARLLNFLDDADRITETGALLLTLPGDLPILRLIYAFEQSETGRAWLRWAGVKEFNDIDPGTAFDFLRACADFADSTIERRAGTLQTWANRFLELRGRRKGVPLRLEDWRPPQELDPSALSRVTVLESGSSADIIQRLATGARHIRVVSGFFTISGYLILAERLTGADVYLLVGQDERNPFARRSVDDAATILRLFRHSLDLGPPSTTRRNEIKKLHQDVLRSLVGIRYFEPRKQQALHAKLYVFDRRAGYATSSNLTVEGLRHKIEVGALKTLSADVDDYINKFDKLFEQATPITLPVLEAIEKSWAFKGPITPFLLFLKAMYELFERLPDLETRSRYELAEFQRRLVRPVIIKLLNYRGAMLISPTGTGKTVMASYVAAYLAQEKRIQRIIVICPNQSIGLSWKNHLAAFGHSAEIVTHGVLRRGEALSVEKQRLLKELQTNPRATDLYIVDECHHFRNEDTIGRENLQRLLRPDDGSARPYCLLLTATPISTGLRNLNMLLQLIHQAAISSVAAIDQVPAVVNVTLPFIVRHYGRREKGRAGLALRFGERLGYFPDIRIKTVRYTSPMVDVFNLIPDLRLVFETGEDIDVQGVLGGEEWIGAAPGREYGLLRAILARRAESSPAAIRSTLNRMIDSIERGMLRPVYREELRAGLKELDARICSSAKDTKLHKLFEEVAALGSRTKILIFSEAVATVGYLVQELRGRFRGRCIEALDGNTSTEARQRLLVRFAPLANEGLDVRPEGRLIDILVTSDTCAEGENLQDATTVINYDLTWTPLRLVQRLGRVDRATDKPRKVNVLNFYPGADEYSRLVRLWLLLNERSKEVSDLTRAHVIGEYERSMENLPVEDMGPVRALYDNEDYEQFLNSLLPVAGYMDAWLSATEEERELARRMPDGVQSGERRNVDGCYVLLRHEEMTYSLLFDRARQSLIRAPDDVTHEHLVKDLVFTERGQPGVNPPENFDDEVAKAVEQWSRTTGIDIEEVTVVAAKYLVSRLSAAGQ